MSYSKRFIKYSKPFYELLYHILSDNRVENGFILSNYFAPYDRVWIFYSRSSGTIDVAIPEDMEKTLELF